MTWTTADLRRYRDLNGTVLGFLVAASTTAMLYLLMLVRHLFSLLETLTDFDPDFTGSWLLYPFAVLLYLLLSVLACVCVLRRSKPGILVYTAAMFPACAYRVWIASHWVELLPDPSGYLWALFMVDVLAALLYLAYAVTLCIWLRKSRRVLVYFMDAQTYGEWYAEVDQNEVKLQPEALLPGYVYTGSYLAGYAARRQDLIYLIENGEAGVITDDFPRYLVVGTQKGFVQTPGGSKLGEMTTLRRLPLQGETLP